MRCGVGVPLNDDGDKWANSQFYLFSSFQAFYEYSGDRRLHGVK